MNWICLLAQATQPAGPPPPQWLQIVGGPFLPLMLGLVLLWVVMIRSKQKSEKMRQRMLSELKKNDRVETIGGVLGTIVEVRDGEVVLKVDETTNTKMRFRRSAIHRVIAEDDKKT
ncbi:MAG: preprotein translocase subunit YajC [Phycisphaerae bacterium]|nr:preprotein translocase subunit YajC [Phycisphaerae bacterium]MDW8263196.1 preprotein translocase subunit YajC [Phycisphaerales bacterium]